MPNDHLIGPLVRRFLLEEVGADRNLSVNTQRSYRDALRLLFRFWPSGMRDEPTQVMVEHLTADVVKSFLRHLEEERGNAVDTRNLRLTALHSLFRFVARQIPELVDHATQIQSIPLTSECQPTCPYLEKAELDALLATPNRVAYKASATTPCCCSCTTPGHARAKPPRPTWQPSSSIMLRRLFNSSAKDVRSDSVRSGHIPLTSCESCSVRDVEGADDARCSSTSVDSG